MADGISITEGTGSVVAADEVTGVTPTLSGTSKVQYVKIVDGTIDSVNKMTVDTSGRIAAVVSYGKSQLFQPINVSVAGDTTLVAAPGAALRIKVINYVLVVSGALSVYFRSGVGGTAITGPMPLASNGGISATGHIGSHLFDVGVNTALVLNLSASVQVAGHLSYFIE